MIRRWIGNALWWASGAGSHVALRRARRDSRRVQERLLSSFLARNAGSEYGRRYGYARIRGVRDFQQSVPVVTYDDLEPWIGKIRDGRPNVLTTEPVVMMEKTSGSSGAAKYIPYTASLLREFQRAIGAWMHDLYASCPSLLGGSQYWAVSPAARDRELTPGGLAIGFDDDTEYLSPIVRRVARWVMAVPGDVGRSPDMGSCHRATLEHLMRCRDLRFMSVWNPSFLTLLMRHLPSGAVPSELWPGLKRISCWTDGAAARFVPDLEALFPGVEIQGKGLLATEGVVSIPISGQPAPVAALTSHFLEFVEEGGRSRRVDELEVGGRYEVLLTTGGGFARYALGDQVEVAAPGCLRFAGRAGGVSDLCGEKLSDAFVGRVLLEASGPHGIRGMAMLAPEWGNPPHYDLFVESGDPSIVAEFVEAHLRASCQYDYCRRLGQLGPVQGVAVRNSAERYVRACEEMGQRSGAVKPAFLRKEFGWRRRLAPETGVAS